MRNIIKLFLQLKNDPANAREISKTKGMLGGLGKGLGSLGGLVGLGVAGAAVAAFTKVAHDSIEAAQEQRQALGQLNAVIESTGGAAGVSAEHVRQLAADLQKVTNYGDEATISAANLLLTFTNIKSDVFDETTKVILDMSTALGQDLKSSSIQVGKALNDPITGMTALRRVGVSFTKEQEEMVKSWVEAGDTLRAQKFILAELNREFGGSAEAARKADGGITALKNAWGDLLEQFGDTSINATSGAFEGLAGVIEGLAGSIQKSKDGWAAAASNFNILTEALSKTELWGGFAKSAKEALAGIGDALGGTVDKVRTGFFNFTKAYQDATTKNAIWLLKSVFGEDELTKAVKGTTTAIRKRADAAGADAAMLQLVAGYTEKATQRANELETALREQAQAAEAARWAGLAAVYGAEVTHKNPLERISYLTKYFQSLEETTDKIPDTVGSAFDEAAAKLRSIVESQIRPTLSEVWQPSGSGERMDEQARRLATVAVQGFGSEWLNTLNQQYQGFDFWKPISDAIASGDDTALKQAAEGILTGENLSQLWNKDLIIERVKKQMEQEKMREAFIQTIVNELQGQGIDVSVEDVNAQVGGGAATADSITQSIKGGLPKSVADAGMGGVFLGALAQNIKENAEGAKQTALTLVKSLNAQLPEVIGEFRLIEAIIDNVGERYGLEAARP